MGGKRRRAELWRRVSQGEPPTSTGYRISTGDLAGKGVTTPPVNGRFDVRELFAEAQVPIIEHNFIDLLQISAGYRYSDYKVTAVEKVNTDTYKVALEFAPVRDIRFRGSYNRAVRAPNVVELFTPQLLALAGDVDPCAPGTGGAPPAATLAQCQLTGVTPAQYGNRSSESGQSVQWPVGR